MDLRVHRRPRRCVLGIGELDRCRVDVTLDDRDLAVALDVYELRCSRESGAHVMRFDALLEGAAVPPTEEVLIAPPRWRGYGFVELLEWLVCARLGVPARTRATWLAPRRGGATGVRRVLFRRGWRLDVRREGGLVRHEGIVPRPGPRPEPRTFRTHLGRPLDFAADWGVFSRDHVDEGTRLLFEVAVARIAMGPASVPLVADVGTGYGPVAIALVSSGLTERAVASDVDLVALSLAGRNARATGAEVELVALDDPAELPPTPVTVCSLPTHVPRDVTDVLVRGLADRARSGVVLVCVHASFESRYRRLFADVGTAAEVLARKTHVVLELSRGSGLHPPPDGPSVWPQ